MPAQLHDGVEMLHKTRRELQKSKENHYFCRADKNDCLQAMPTNVAYATGIKAPLKAALADKINDRETLHEQGDLT